MLLAAITVAAITVAADLTAAAPRIPNVPADAPGWVSSCVARVRAAESDAVAIPLATKRWVISTSFVVPAWYLGRPEVKHSFGRRQATIACPSPPTVIEGAELRAWIAVADECLER